MRMCFRLLSVLLVVGMLLSMTVFAEQSKISYAVDGGSIYFDGETGMVVDCDLTVTRLVIPKTIGGVAVTGIANGGLSYKNLESVVLPSGLVKIGANAFSNCTQLKEITIPGGVEMIGHRAFADCRRLTKITIPDTVSRMGSEYNSQFTSPFTGCESLTEIKVDTNNVSFCSVGGVLFNKTKTVLYQYPAGKTEKNYEIPDGIEIIKETAFEYAMLREITIPASVTEIKEEAFDHCRSLQDVYYRGTQKQWNEIAIARGNEDLLQANIHVNTSDGGTGEIKLDAPVLELLTTGKLQSNDEFDIKWSKVQGAESYTITVTDSKGNVEFIDSVSYADAVYTLSKLTADIYQITVVAVAEDVQSEASNVVTIEILPSEHICGVVLLVYVPAKEPTSSKAGNSAYYLCPICEKIYLDKEASAQSTKEAVTIPPTGTAIDNLENYYYGRYKKAYQWGTVYKNSSYYQKVADVELSGDMAKDFVAIAKTQEGNKEGNRGYTEYGHYVGNDTGGWCGFFAYWCARAAGAADEIYPHATGASVTPFKNTACSVYSWNDLMKGEVVPRAGDLIIFKAESSADRPGTADLAGGSHIEIVLDYEKSGERHIFDTVGGNTGEEGIVKIRNNSPKCDSRGKTGWGGGLEYIYAIVRPAWNLYERQNSAKTTVLQFKGKGSVFISNGSEELSMSRPIASFGMLAYSANEDTYTATMVYDPAYMLQVVGMEKGEADISITYLDEANKTVSDVAFERVALDVDETLQLAMMVEECGANLYIYDRMGNPAEAWSVNANAVAKQADNTLTNHFLDPQRDVAENVPTDDVYNGNGGKKHSGNAFINENESPVSEPFTDVRDTDWFYDEVVYVYGNGIMNGISDTRFAPNATVTRGMIVTILHRMAGAPDEDGNVFSDVTENAYYAQAVAWAAENHIVEGFEDQSFRPDEPVTREQLAAMMYRYTQNERQNSNKNENVLQKFNDAQKISPWAVDAMQWACGKQILTGMENGSLKPQNSATRAQTAAIIMRYFKS